MVTYINSGNIHFVYQSVSKLLVRKTWTLSQIPIRRVETFGEKKGHILEIRFFRRRVVTFSYPFVDLHFLNFSQH